MTRVNPIKALDAVYWLVKKYSLEMAGLRDQTKSDPKVEAWRAMAHKQYKGVHKALDRLEPELEEAVRLHQKVVKALKKKQ